MVGLPFRSIPVRVPARSSAVMPSPKTAALTAFARPITWWQTVSERFAASIPSTRRGIRSRAAQRCCTVP
ncbi:hypothetical protein DN069_12925 [Streptacidiphilus pinicola]|uniref:Uncharacterized protein n=1 Tax=Streptacidiphilus pinicola TaxID=2219663 RepID=A0A2X0J4P4_9ACTN|nr:hypothetical protein DN069_12925 [Streptacidiphilus pinicola]